MWYHLESKNDNAFTLWSLPAEKSKMSPMSAFPSAIFSTAATTPLFSPAMALSVASHKTLVDPAKAPPQAGAAGPQAAPAMPAARTTVLFVAPID
jgi:hypothetical protein